MMVVSSTFVKQSDFLGTIIADEVIQIHAKPDGGHLNAGYLYTILRLKLINFKFTI